MVDYDKSTGSVGTMRIRDLDGVISFWLHAANTTTWNAALPYSWTVNGSSGSSTYNYPRNGGWRMLRSWTVSTNQRVTFSIGNTGTSGFGGPTSHSVTITRVVVPAAPSVPTIDQITGTSARATFNDPGNTGGAPITSRRVGWSTSSSGNPTGTRTGNSPNIFTGLSPGTTYYVRASVRNSAGWSNWSGARAMTTQRVPGRPSAPVASNILADRATLTFSDPSDTGSTAITSRQIGYATTNADPTVSSNIFTGTSPRVIAGLDPGKTYWFATRARNTIGWGPWSTRRQVQTEFALRVRYQGQWRYAIPYVRHSGTWRKTTPHVRQGTQWRSGSG